MNSIFRKTLIASALAAVFSSVVIAADDSSTTIDGAKSNSQGEMQPNESTSTHPAMPTHEDEFNKTMDSEKPAAGNEGDAEMQKSTDTPVAGEKANKPGKDMDKPSNTGDKQKNANGRPLTEHQDNVIEEEEEEEEIGNTQMDNESDVDMQKPMNEKPYGSTSAGTPANKGGLYDMSANELNGMDVITSDGKDVGGIEKIVMSPDSQNIHAVITVGGLLGVGGKTILIPLENFTRAKDELHVKATQAELKAMNDYGSEDYIELEGDAAVSSAIRTN
ncbi:PRC-barrel domain-containing protein [Methylophaga sp.]|uniref:PRC-barrel domain-containing protein n=1 Tax=Methylophaga sp. TaxID=2024840 RepID=UPI0027287695|nr:PRC-barrel domain-containing protein [Methylophaga sp.]MDO8826186.1 PRC-barrel domain-containing protein [Methylophaga sp.]